MNNETGKQLIKSATAVLCVASVCISTVISTGKIADTIKSTASSAQVQQSNSSFDGDTQTDEAVIDNGTGADIAVDPSATEQTDAAQPDSTEAADTGSSSSQQSSGSSSSGSQSAAKQNSASKEMSKAEIINYCNTALNKAKAAKVGYNKKMVREVKGSTDGISPSPRWM